MSQFRLLPIPFWSDDSPSTTATTCYEQYFMDDGWRANARISRTEPRSGEGTRAPTGREARRLHAVVERAFFERLFIPSVYSLFVTGITHLENRIPCSQGALQAFANHPSAGIPFLYTKEAYKLDSPTSFAAFPVRHIATRHFLSVVEKG